MVFIFCNLFDAFVKIQYIILYFYRLPKEKDAKGIAKEVPGMKRKRKSTPLNAIDEKRQNKDVVDSILRSTKILREDYSTGTAE